MILHMGHSPTQYDQRRLFVCIFFVIFGLARMIQCILAKDIHNDCWADPGVQDKLHAYNDFCSLSLSDTFSYLVG